MTQHTTTPGEDTDYGQLPLLRYYEDRRACPRVDFKTAAVLTTDDHQVLKAVARNISGDGLQLRCDPATARAIHPHRTRIVPGTGPHLMLRFELPLDGKPHAFAARCQVCYVAVRSQREIAFGLRFTSVRLEAKKVLAAFIMESLRPRD